MKALCNAVNRHVACYGDDVLCLLKPFSVLLFILLPIIINAQDIKLTNPSLEGSPSEGNPPPNWYSIEKTPDTQPGVYKITMPASDGNSYVGMVCNKELQEGITQQLTVPVDSGKTYSISFDLAYAPLYAWKVNYGSLVIYGGNSKGERKEILWQSGPFYNEKWKKFTAIFTPSKKYTYIVFSPYKVKSDDLTNVAGVMIDNLSDIKEVIKLDLTSKNTCLGFYNGEATARVLNADDNYTYLWEPAGDTLNTIKGLAPGEYKVTVRSRSGATTYGVVNVNASSINANVSIVPINCFGDKGIINVEAKGGKPPYTFLVNDKAETSGLINNVTAGSYRIKVQDMLGCTSVLEEVVFEEPALLKLKDVINKPVSCSMVKDGQIIFNATGGTPPYVYNITGYGTQSNNIIGHLDPGQYHYEVSDSHACSVEGNAEITKEWRDCAVFVPTAFSPNGDGSNDIFRAKVHDDISDFHIMVFGRWGQLIFESKDPAQGWNGTQRDMLLPAGSYLWAVTYTDSKKQAIKQQGSLVLIR